MEKLQLLIWSQADILQGHILKVDSIINHQINPTNMFSFGKTLGDRFSDKKVDRILTAEVSGIAIAAMTGLAMNVGNVTIARKSQPVTMTGTILSENAPSPTQGGYVTLNVSNDFLREGENVLIIDDFLASGETLLALARMVHSANAHLVGIGVLIEKSFQGGRFKLREALGGDTQIEALASIKSMERGKKIEFE